MKFYIKGIEVKFSFLFFAMLTLSFAADEQALSYIAVCSVLLHECGHIMTMALLSKLPQQICFGVFGIRIFQSRLSYFEEAVVSLGGPLVNVALCAIFFVVHKIFGLQFFLLCAAVNLAIAAFNLLPIVPLDGGAALKAFLNIRFPSPLVLKITRGVSTVLIFVIVVFGVFLTVKTRFNATLLFTGIYLAVLSVKSIKRC